MTSSSSGYVAYQRNESEKIHYEYAVILYQSFFVPSGHDVMTSFNLLTRPGQSVNVAMRNSCAKYKIWDAYGLQRDFARIFYCDNTTYTVQCYENAYYEYVAAHFKLFFLFFSENEAPRRKTSGLWNCSVENYPSFRHHMECNMKTECEDGRDETSFCPFSSEECDGLVALCNSCYKVVDHLHLDMDDYQDVSEHARKVENTYKSFRATVGFSVCTYDPYSIIMKTSGVYWSYLSYNYFVGWFYNDVALPNMYRICIHDNDRTVFHHYFGRDSGIRRGIKYPAFLFLKHMSVLSEPKLRYLNGSLAILFKLGLNNTTEELIYTRGIALKYPKSSLSKEEYYVTVCDDGSMTQKQLLCGSVQDEEECSYRSSFLCVFPEPVQHTMNLTDLGVTFNSMFTCSVDDSTTVSYSLLCDFTQDCPDYSDESFCQHPPCNSTMFTCSNSQCVTFNKVCDQATHCQDDSDERNCVSFKVQTVSTPHVAFPALVNFDGISQFTSIPMNSTEPCPDSHYRCPGQFNDCLPIYTRCNGMYDCIDRQDEEGCVEVQCQGLLRCRLSTICVHSNHVCDGWPHCPMWDDELWCSVVCPVGCLCQLHSLFCPQPFHAAPFPQIRSVDATGSRMTPSDFSGSVYLIQLILIKCSLDLLPVVKLSNLKFLDLSYNEIHHVNITSFLGLENLKSLSTSNNPITTLSTDLTSDVQQTVLRTIDLSHTALSMFDSKVFSHFVGLQKLNLTFTDIHTISLNGFQFTLQLTELYTHGSPIKTFPPDIFTGLLHLHIISSQNYKLCCSEILPPGFDVSTCSSPNDEISSCEDLLRSWTYRGFLWLVACLSVSGNVFCFCARLLRKGTTSSSGFSVFVTHLTMADFLMGFYMAVIGSADDHYRGRYLHHDDTWKHSVTCKVAGFLSLLSSEVSALIICLITLDRFIVLCFPFSALRFERTSAMLVCLVVWLTGCSLALVPLLPVTSHWEFYSQTGICIPLPVTRKEFEGKQYSFGVLIVLNFALFLLISAGQAFIYRSIQSNSLKTNSTKTSQDMTIAQRLITIALTDFMCWFPIGLCGMVALSGIPIPGEVNVALAIFILPLNSAINPFLYTFNTLAEKWRKSKESELLKWMATHYVKLG